MTTILLTTDLMTSSQVAAAAADVGAELVAVESVAKAVARLQDDGADLIVLDLGSGAAPAELIASLNSASVRPKVLAFGPHVHVEKLKAARAAGCDDVLTRGQFFANMHQVLQGEV